MRDRDAPRADIAPLDSGPGARDHATVRSVGCELDDLALRLRRLGEAGILTEQQRETLQTIADELAEVHRRLRARSRRFDVALEALEEVAERVDDLARNHQECAYGPALAELAERIAVNAKALTA